MERKESESEDDFQRGADAARQSRGQDDDAWSEWTFDEPIDASTSSEPPDDSERAPSDSSVRGTASTSNEQRRSTNDPSAENVRARDNTVTDSTTDHPTTDHPTTDHPITDHPTTDHPTTNYPTTDDSTEDDSPIDNSSLDDSTAEELFSASERSSADDSTSDTADVTEPEPRGLFESVTGESVADEPQGLFDDLLSGTPIFENKEVLRPSYTPHELPHRTEQINKMATILVAALRGETPSNILIYGKTGTGKTASAKFVSQELESTSKKYRVPCEVEYINCEVTDTQYRVLAQLANTFLEENERLIDEEISALEAKRSQQDSPTEHSDSTNFERPANDPIDTPVNGDSNTDQSSNSDDSTGSNRFEHESLTTHEDVQQRIESLREEKEAIESVPMTGWPTDRVYQVFFEAVDRRERVVVIMLDEIDKLVEKSGDDTLYNLSRMNSELENSRVSIIGISNDLKFTDFLDPRVKSSLGEEEIVFPPYDASQLRDILQHRADVAFIDGVLTPEVIPLCAAFAAQEHGDARRALDLLRTAGELAERSQSDVVLEEHVRQAQDKIELDRVVEVVRTLPAQSKLVLFAIIQLEKNGVRNINTGEVFNIYKHLCNEVDTDVLTQRRVTDLISELDMLGIVNAVVVSKGRYGRTKEMSLSVPLEDTEAVLVADSRLGDIDDVNPFIQSRFDG